MWPAGWRLSITVLREGSNATHVHVGFTGVSTVISSEYPFANSPTNITINCQLGYSLLVVYINIASQPKRVGYCAPWTHFSKRIDKQLRSPD